MQQFRAEFFQSVSRFITLFGGLWIAVILPLSLYETYTAYTVGNYYLAVSSIVMVVYVANVFWSFRADLKRCMKDHKQEMIPDLKRFLFDAAIILIFFVPKAVSIFSAEGENISVYAFNTFSQGFLTLFFYFFRFVYHFLFMENK